jgi:diketogulonate reductase-like aldo/keto reductase
LYLIHWPVSFPFTRPDEYYPKDANGKPYVIDVPLEETWHAMEKLVDKGLVKSIGVSNFSSAEVSQLITNKDFRHKPVVNQVEIHPLWQQLKLKKDCEAQKVLLTAYSPLGNFNPNDPNAISVLNQPDIKDIAAKHEKSPAQIALRWNLQMGNIVLAKSVSPQRIKENFDIWDFNLEEDDMQRIHEVGIKHAKRMLNPTYFKNNETPYYSD